MNIDPKATLSGAYQTATLTLPNGSVSSILVRMVDGKPVVVDGDALAFEQRFNDTETVPADFVPSDTAILTKKDSGSARINLVAADMVAYIGSPDRILAQGCLDPERLAHLSAHPASATLARRICITMGGKWAQVARLIPQTYPDRP